MDLRFESSHFFPTFNRCFNASGDEAKMTLSSAHRASHTDPLVVYAVPHTL